MNILLLSGYNTHSHNYWAKLLIEKFPQYNWTFLSLPPRKFSWRIRGNALSWKGSNNSELEKEYDTLIATSMVDMASLIGLYPHLGKANKVIYFHENQFEYPLSSNKNDSTVESMMVTIYGALAADKVIFNSNYNRESFLKGAKSLFKRINDFSPTSLIDEVERKSRVIPVPICNSAKISEKIKNSIIWNHRWEYDKNPDDFLETLKILSARNIDFKLIIMGIEFKDSPPAFSEIKKLFNDRILCWGHQTPDEYKKWLSKGEFIVSTAIHEFQGLAVMEGVQYGAIPVVPNRLSYPQWFNKEYLYEETPKDMADMIILNFSKRKENPNLEPLTWDHLKEEYNNLLTLSLKE